MTRTASPEPLVTVVVCTRDRLEDIGRCLPTILANDYPNFEVIVVDQSTTDACQELLDHIPDPRLVRLRLNYAGKARAENAALERARGEFIAFTDDDCEVPRNWLRRATSVLAAELDAAIVFGAVAAAPHDWAEMHVPTFLPVEYRKIRGRWIRYPVDGGIGANMVVRRSLFDRLGGFDEWVGPGSPFRSGDDFELVYRSLWKGYALVQDPENIVIHWGMRPYATGAARRSWHNNYYGMGATHMRHVRRGNWVAAPLFFRQVWWAVELIIPRVIERNRNLAIRRSLYLLLGAFKGLTSPLSLKWPVEESQQEAETADTGSASRAR